MGCYVAGADSFWDILQCFLYSLTGGDPTILGLAMLGLVLVISYQARLNGTLALVFGAIMVWAIYSIFNSTSEALLIVFGVLIIGIALKVLNGLIEVTEN